MAVELLMNSREILESYLDRELTEVLGETALQNLIASGADQKLSGTEAEILAALIQRRHNEVAMEKIRRNVSLLEFRDVLEGQQAIINLDSENDTKIEEFIVRLEKIYNKLSNKCVRLEKDKQFETDKLEKTVEYISKNNVFVSDSVESLQGPTREINDYNLSMLSKP